MIQGIVPQICLWCIVVGTAVGLWLHLRTRWRWSWLGRQLAVYLAVTLMWWTSILIGTYWQMLVGSYPRWLQILQAIVFMLKAGVIVWRTIIQFAYRPKHKKEENAMLQRREKHDEGPVLPRR